MNDLERSLRKQLSLRVLCLPLMRARRRVLLPHVNPNSAGYKRACHVFPRLEGALGFDLLLQKFCRQVAGDAALGGCVGANCSSLMGRPDASCRTKWDQLEGFNLEFYWTPSRRAFLKV